MRDLPLAPDSLDNCFVSVESIAEEMICGGNPIQVLRLGKCFEERIEIRLRAECVLCALHEVLGDLHLINELTFGDSSGITGRIRAESACLSRMPEKCDARAERNPLARTGKSG